MKKFFYRIWSRFLTAFGNVKIFRFPLFFIYDPDDVGVTGRKTAQILKMLKPGDVLLRGYVHYLDGMFIPGDYSHGAIYAGDWKIIHAVAEGVSYIDAIEFLRCDRIAVLRPAKGADEAVEYAKKCAAERVPYDFGYDNDVSALYCFELVGQAYRQLDIKTKDVKTFWGMLRRKNVYLADSFFESKDFEKIFEFNPKRKVDFVKEKYER